MKILIEIIEGKVNHECKVGGELEGGSFPLTVESLLWFSEIASSLKLIHRTHVIKSPHPVPKNDKDEK